MKSQSVRVIDVALLGPALVWVARQPRLTPTSRAFLALTGGATITYNLINYLRYR